MFRWSILLAGGLLLFACKSKTPPARDLRGPAGPAQVAARAEKPLATGTALAPIVPPASLLTRAQVEEYKLGFGKGEARDERARWPLLRLRSWPAGRSQALPPGATAISLAVSREGKDIVVATRGPGIGKTALFAWDAAGPLRPLRRPALEMTRIASVAFSPFTPNLYVAGKVGKEWAIARYRLNGQDFSGPLTLYRSKKRLGHLVPAAVRWEGKERLFFGREHSRGAWQVASIFDDGKGEYEVTAPAARARAIAADREGKKPTGDNRTWPRVHVVRSAVPLSVNPRSGALTWRDRRGMAHEIPYDSNWGASRELGGISPRLAVSWSPNAFYRLRWIAGARGVALLGPDGQETARLAPGRALALAPAFAPSGRSIVGVTGPDGKQRLETFAVKAPLAAVRYLPDVHLPNQDLAALGRDGIVFYGTREKQIYGPYERLRYDACHNDVQVPIFASIDGFLELLHAGFTSLFVQAERHVSLPRLARLLALVEKVAAHKGLGRVARIARVAARVLRGDYQHPEGKLILAEKRARSELHGRKVDFGDFHPRGPYAIEMGHLASPEKERGRFPELKHYFRAFKYFILLRLQGKELTLLQGQRRLRQAWKDWVRVQAPFLWPSRNKTILEPKAPLPAYVRRDCVPARIRGMAPRAFPLAWGVDNEILESTLERLGVAADCTVKGRGLPSGLDLLTALGGAEAAAIQAEDYARWPGLKAAHAQLRARFSKQLPRRPFPMAWLHLVQRLTTDTYIPQGVSPTLWRRRLMQTALASWTSFRHTTVLVTATVGAECGDGFEGFEQLSREPVRGTVDPVPRSWAQVGWMLRTLGELATKRSPGGALTKILGEASRAAHAFGRMAARQMQGKPLRPAQYARIQRFAREVEHRFLVMKAAAAGQGKGSLKNPAPMRKIVDVAKSAGRVWHAAVGDPLAVVALIGDRGILVPSSGALYSYYEVTAGKRLDDAQWGRFVDKTPRPPWVPPVLGPMKKK